MELLRIKNAFKAKIYKGDFVEEETFDIDDIVQGKILSTNSPFVNIEFEDGSFLYQINKEYIEQWGE